MNKKSMIGGDTANPVLSWVWLLALSVLLTACVGNGIGFDSGAQVARSELDLPPVCLSTDSDTNGDGWGWENEQSCKVAGSGFDDADLPVGIVYFIWHCITKTPVYDEQFERAQLPAGEELNTTHVLSGLHDWGDEHRFHWWDKPDEGYYCLGDEPEVLRKHMAMLRDAGIDFIVVDITNHPNTKSLAAENFILRSLRPLLDAAKEVADAPKIVPWVPLIAENAGTRNELDLHCNTSPGGALCQQLQSARDSSMVDHVSDLILSEYPDQTYIYDDKPLLIEPVNDSRYPRELVNVVRPEIEQSWTVKGMWGLQTGTDNWQFLSTCQNAENFFATNGWSEQGCGQPVSAGGEQISVAAGYQYTYISDPFQRDPANSERFVGGMPKFEGRTLAQQFRVAFEHRDLKPLVLVTGWNEWIASRFIVDGRSVFVDAYNAELNRDIEPGGRTGDLYYFLLRGLIARYRAGAPFSFEDYFLTTESILDPEFYWDTYPDLQQVFTRNNVNGLTNHWLTAGINEGRRPSIVFDAGYYAQKYSDLNTLDDASARGLLQHFLDSGFVQGRRGSEEFLASAYINRYGELQARFGRNGYYQAFLHYLQYGESSGHNARP